MNLSMAGVRMWLVNLHTKDHLMFSPDGRFGNTVILATTTPEPDGTRYSRTATYTVQYKEAVVLDSEDYRCIGKDVHVDMEVRSEFCCNNFNTRLPLSSEMCSQIQGTADELHPALEPLEVRPESLRYPVGVS